MFVFLFYKNWAYMCSTVLSPMFCKTSLCKTTPHDVLRHLRQGCFPYSGKALCICIFNGYGDPTPSRRLRVPETHRLTYPVGVK